MDNEVPLPPPRRIRHRSPRGSASARGPSPSTSLASSFRKTHRLSRFDDCSSQPSSDPALFSSDDIPASGLENYNAGPMTGVGRKRRYRGTWWGEKAIDPKKKRADFKEKRNVDSGVWMGSDESGAESLLQSEDGPGWGGRSVEDGVGSEELREELWSTGITPDESEEHRFARSVVNDCLEKGEEIVDLGNFNMRSIPAGLLSPLQLLTKAAPLAENFFSSLQPFLSIYLSGNALLQLHNELFELSILKVLSVRNNKLQELPYTIQKLRSLEVLNISVNRLTYLPWELLKLFEHGELKHLTACPNPFLQIEECPIKTWHCERIQKETEPRSERYDLDSESECEPEPIYESPRFEEYEDVPPPSAWTAIHVATGPITRFDMEGRAIEENPKFSLVTTACRFSSASAPSSLRELALRAVCKAYPSLEYTNDEEIAAEFPPFVAPLLQKAKKVQAAGGQQCSVCQREYVIPRTEWLEWWDCTPYENGGKRPRASGEMIRPLPFKRFGCSGTCVPASEA
ncbi:uncharacterized protein N7483_000254 [Penicillium malachiteum]|uniref:uncharacterized protein n=1 Tax=Penicillium malachiteum TaxID=1324776 RepID=UPI002548DB6B|nr:uncharacterized protein N7483_000254 [Penicillium malachiteum]KAJ5735129.1 hypothetical protein N7483_000254 [Penicillium malachiteum]